MEKDAEIATSERVHHPSGPRDVISRALGVQSLHFVLAQEGLIEYFAGKGFRGGSWCDGSRNLDLVAGFVDQELDDGSYNITYRQDAHIRDTGSRGVR